MIVGQFEQPNQYHKNQGGGVFTLVTGTSIGDRPKSNPSKIAIADYDLDGFLDVAISNSASDSGNDNSADELHHNTGDGNFTAVFGTSIDLTMQNNHPALHPQTKFAMWADVNEDGYPDIFFGRCLHENVPGAGGRSFVLRQNLDLYNSQTFSAVGNCASAHIGAVGDLNGDGQYACGARTRDHAKARLLVCVLLTSRV